MPHGHTGLHRGKRKKEDSRGREGDARRGAVGWGGQGSRGKGKEGKELQLEYHASITPKARIGGFSEV